MHVVLLILNVVFGYLNYKNTLDTTFPAWMRVIAFSGLIASSIGFGATLAKIVV